MLQEKEFVKLKQKHLENYLVTIFTGDSNKSISKNIELADIDKDGVMEIILVLDGEIEVHKYNNGFYY